MGILTHFEFGFVIQLPFPPPCIQPCLCAYFQKPQLVPGDDGEEWSHTEANIMEILGIQFPFYKRVRYVRV